MSVEDRRIERPVFISIAKTKLGPTKKTYTITLEGSDAPLYSSEITSDCI